MLAGKMEICEEKFSWNNGDMLRGATVHGALEKS